VTLRGSGVIEGTALAMCRRKVSTFVAELTAVRRLSDTPFLEDVKPQLRTPYTLADLTTLYQKDRMVHPPCMYGIYRA
jgi:hypothetical protein